MFQKVGLLALILMLILQYSGNSYGDIIIDKKKKIDESKDLNKVREDFFQFSYEFFSWLEEIIVRAEKKKLLEHPYKSDSGVRLSACLIDKGAKENGDFGTFHRIIDNHKNTLRVISRNAPSAYKFEGHEMLPIKLMEALVTIIGFDKYSKLNKIIENNVVRLSKKEVDRLVSEYQYTPEEAYNLVSGKQTVTEIVQKVQKIKTFEMLKAQAYRVDGISYTDYTKSLANFILGCHFDENLLSRKIIPNDIWTANDNNASFITHLEKYPMNNYGPIAKFIDIYKDNASSDLKMRMGLGSQLIPFFDHYFEKADLVTRIRIFKLMALDFKKLSNELIQYKKDMIQFDKALQEGKRAITPKEFNAESKLALNVFLSSGPMVIKYLQQLREQLHDSGSEIAKLLSYLEKGRPMPDAIANQKVMTILEITMKNLTGIYSFENVDWRLHPTKKHIASIGEVRRLKYLEVNKKLKRYENEKSYFIKIQRDGIMDIFEREERMVNAMVTDPSILDEFDLGLVKTLQNMITGIKEETDAQYERQNLINGKKAYVTDLPDFLKSNAADIDVVTIPKRFRTSFEVLSKSVLKRSNRFGILNNLLFPPESNETDKAILVLNHIEEHNQKANSEENLKRRVDDFEKIIPYDMSAILSDDEDLVMRRFVAMKAAPGQDIEEVLNNGSLQDLKRTHAAILQLYKVFLYTALNNQPGSLNFYHGDLHRNNIKILLERTVPLVTLIDFGNAGILSAIEKDHLSNMLFYASKIVGKDTESLHYIELLKNEIVKLALVDPIYAQPDVRSVMESYFDIAFNPSNTRGMLDKAKRDMQLVTESDKDDFARRLAHSIIKSSLTVKKFQAMEVLANKFDTPSFKLFTVFNELSKNGVALPTKTIFFNKSKMLLEGMLKAIEEKIKDKGNQTDLDGLGDHNQVFSEIVKSF